MTIAQSLVAFVVAAGILAITPGVDTAMVLRTATIEGARRASAAAIGIVIGCLTWGAAVAVGVGALIATSPVAFTALTWAGALYLAFLGVRLLWQPRSTALSDVDTGASSDDGAVVWLRRGLVTNLLNPKVGVFYVTFLPQFVPVDVAVGPFTFLLAAIHGALKG